MSPWSRVTQLAKAGWSGGQRLWRVVSRSQELPPLLQAGHLSYKAAHLPLGFKFSFGMKNIYVFPENFVYSKSVFVRERFCPPHLGGKLTSRSSSSTPGGYLGRRRRGGGSRPEVPLRYRKSGTPGGRARLFRARRAPLGPPASEPAEAGLAWAWGGGGMRWPRETGVLGAGGRARTLPRLPSPPSPHGLRPRRRRTEAGSEPSRLKPFPSRHSRASARPLQAPSLLRLPPPSFSGEGCFVLYYYSFTLSCLCMREKKDCSYSSSENRLRTECFLGNACGNSTRQKVKERLGRKRNGVCCSAQEASAQV